MAERLDLVAVGAANVDLIMLVDKFAGADEEVSAKGFRLEGGGSAANVAVGASRLGLKAGFIGNIGTDVFGSILEKSFKEEGVDITHLKKLNSQTGVAVCVVDGKGERSIYVYNETNLMFSEKQLDEAYIASSRCVYVSSMQGELAFKAIKHLCDIAYVHGVPVFFDPGHILAEKGIQGLRKTLEKSTILKLNREESVMLTGTRNVEEASLKILAHGPSVVLITLGEEGCYLRTSSLGRQIPGYKSFKAVDRTGAGDSFNAAFIAGFLKGWSLEKCVKFGNLVAGVSVTRIGARSTPTVKELKAYGEYAEFEDG
ncbi:MAG: carbohydrate kinase family protein [Candidatus Bathyarchaeia archaeon]